jgi:hypothetical protein
MTEGEAGNFYGLHSPSRNGAKRFLALSIGSVLDIGGQILAAGEYELSRNSTFGQGGWGWFLILSYTIKVAVTLEGANNNG